MATRTLDLVPNIKRAGFTDRPMPKDKVGAPKPSREFCRHPQQRGYTQVYYGTTTQEQGPQFTSTCGAQHGGISLDASTRSSPRSERTAFTVRTRLSTSTSLPTNAVAGTANNLGRFQGRSFQTTRRSNPRPPSTSTPERQEADLSSTFQVSSLSMSDVEAEASTKEQQEPPPPQPARQLSYGTPINVNYNNSKNNMVHVRVRSNEVLFQAEEEELRAKAERLEAELHAFKEKKAGAALSQYEEDLRAQQALKEQQFTDNLLMQRDTKVSLLLHRKDASREKLSQFKAQTRAKIAELETILQEVDEQIEGLDEMYKRCVQDLEAEHEAELAQGLQAMSKRVAELVAIKAAELQHQPPTSHLRQSGPL
uniref:Uncharacterized protein n=1 Tax=Eutreptiella gymnastica TaxID=73025 RepID=A0A7S1NEA8_9EUGL|mmetsp:Transcript_25082/g.45359  ORF Transcript_25082/g.45359 Transcript_25082/m.45359 type:complete len:367 (+) Transcript_25082:51-1151(+)